MHFLITTTDSFKTGFTVFSAKLEASTIYEALRKNAISLDATTPSELPRKIKKVWRLDSDKLRSTSSGSRASTPTTRTSRTGEGTGPNTRAATPILKDAREDKKSGGQEERAGHGNR